jgi:hypothetical protein
MKNNNNFEYQFFGVGTFFKRKKRTEILDHLGPNIFRKVSVSLIVILLNYMQSNFFEFLRVSTIILFLSHTLLFVMLSLIVTRLTQPLRS